MRERWKMMIQTLVRYIRSHDTPRVAAPSGSTLRLISRTLTSEGLTTSKQHSTAGSKSTSDARGNCTFHERCILKNLCAIVVWWWYVLIVRCRWQPPARFFMLKMTTWSGDGGVVGGTCVDLLVVRKACDTMVGADSSQSPSIWKKSKVHGTPYYKMWNTF